jgi:hypothetical protein
LRLQIKDKEQIFSFERAFGLASQSLNAPAAVTLNFVLAKPIDWNPEALDLIEFWMRLADSTGSSALATGMAAAERERGWGGGEEL